MSAVMKYKVYEFGKDFGMSSTQVMDLIEKYFERPKNHMTALTDKELDMLFEYITRERGRSPPRLRRKGRRPVPPRPARRIRIRRSRRPSPRRPRPARRNRARARSAAR